MELKDFQIGDTVFKIIKKKSTDEYIVTVTKDKIRIPERDYYTDDLEDAVETLFAMTKEEVNNLKKENKNGI